MKHDGYNTNNYQPSYKVKFNNREYQDELGLNVTAMDYRQYDNAIGRFNGIDALSEMSYSSTPYHFGYNNPVFWADPSGLLSQGFIDSLLKNSRGGKTTWTNDGTGLFSNGQTQHIDENGNYFETTADEHLPTVQYHKNLGSKRNAGITESHLYKYGKYYQNYRDNMLSSQLDSFQSDMDVAGTIPVLGEVFDLLNAGVSVGRGNYSQAGLSLAATIPIAGLAATAVKFQKHHIIPKAIYRDAGKALQEVIDLDGAFNLKKLPTPFHGNHPQYSEYVAKQLRMIQDATPGSIKALQKDLNSMINQAYDNYKTTGENLNEYFRKINNQ